MPKDNVLEFIKKGATPALLRKMTTSASSVNVLVSPSVLFTAGEIYQRRNDSALRVVGALMGSCTVKPDSSVDIHIRQCYVVPHSEVADQISINSEYYKQRSELFKKCYGSQQQIVGWFSIGEEGAEIPPSNTGFINDSFGREVSISGASSGLNVHLDMAISKEGGGFKYGCTVTDVKGKTQSVAASCRVEFKASEAFAGTHMLLFSDQHF